MLLRNQNALAPERWEPGLTDLADVVLLLLRIAAVLGQRTREAHVSRSRSRGLSFFLGGSLSKNPCHASRCHLTSINARGDPKPPFLEENTFWNSSSPGFLLLDCFSHPSRQGRPSRVRESFIATYPNHKISYLRDAIVPRQTLSSPFTANKILPRQR